MLVIIAWIVWISIWGVIGCTTVKSIIDRVRTQREVNSYMTMWAENYKLQKAASEGVYKVIDIESIGKVDLSDKKEDQA